MKDFIRSLMSIDESKNSILIYCLLGALILGFWKTLRIGDFPNNLLLLVQSLVVAVGAINVTKQIINKNDINKTPVDIKNETPASMGNKDEITTKLGE